MINYQIQLAHTLTASRHCTAKEHPYTLTGDTITPRRAIKTWFWWAPVILVIREESSTLRLPNDQRDFGGRVQNANSLESLMTRTLNLKRLINTSFSFSFIGISERSSLSPSRPRDGENQLVGDFWGERFTLAVDPSIARSVKLVQKEKTKTLWTICDIHHALGAMNRTPMRKHKWKTPFELATDKKPDLAHMHKFGCKAYSLNKSIPRKIEKFGKIYSILNK